MVVGREGGNSLMMCLIQSSAGVMGMILGRGKRQ